MQARVTIGILALLAFGLALVAAAGTSARADEAKPETTTAKPAPPANAPSSRDYGIKDTARPSDPVAMGGFIFRQRCGVCHSKTTDGRTPYGPHLAGLMGREIGSTGWKKHSTAFKDADFVWDEAKLDRFLKDPKGTIPGARTDVAVRFKRARTALIAYLKTLS